MKIIKYFFEFISIISLFCIFKIIGLRNASHLGSVLGRAIGPLFRSKKIIKQNIKIGLGEMDTELFKEWFQAFSQAAGITLHIENVYGDNSHHIIESCFKDLARSLREALEIDKRIKNKVPSTKGVL